MDIRSPVMGMLSYRHAEDGAKIEKDDLLCAVECMKTFFDLRAPGAGIVRYHAKLGEAVGEGDVVATIDEMEQPA